MQVAKPVGRSASVKKYDILSALAAFGLSQDKHVQRQVLRLMALITTRYNWQKDELTIGQNEIAKLWACDTRTVKREMSKFRASGWLVEKRGAARGRVAVHGLCLDKIMGDTKPIWENIGPDFVARAETPIEAETPSNVVKFAPSRVHAPSDDGSLWSGICKSFYDDDPASFAAWLSRLDPVGREDDRFVISAPTRFHANYVESHFGDRLLREMRRLDPTVRTLRIVH